MRISEIRDMSAVELETRVKELKAELFNLRFQNATNQLENPMRIVDVKRSIAKIMTVLREIEIQEAAKQ